MNDNDRKSALVTGASSGVGAAVAQRLASEGYNLMLVSRRMEPMKKLAQSIENSGSGDVKVMELDIRSADSCTKVADATMEAYGQLDALVNCAGVALGREPAHQANEDEWTEMIRTNYEGPIQLIRRLLPGMVERGTGHVINIGALAALHPHPGSVVYASAKEAMRMFLKCLREDTLGTGIRVTNIDPGIIKTEFATVRFRGDKDMATKILDGMRPLEPADVAQCVWFALGMPAHVNIDQISVLPTDQTSPTRVHRG